MNTAYYDMLIILQQQTQILIRNNAQTALLSKAKKSEKEESGYKQIKG